MSSFFKDATASDDEVILCSPLEWPSFSPASIYHLILPRFRSGDQLVSRSVCHDFIRARSFTFNALIGALVYLLAVYSKFCHIKTIILNSLPLSLSVLVSISIHIYISTYLSVLICLSLACIFNVLSIG